MDTFVSLFLKVKGNVPPTLSRIPDLQHVLGCDQMSFVVTLIDQHPHVSQSEDRASAVAPKYISWEAPQTGAFRNQQEGTDLHPGSLHIAQWQARESCHF